MQLPVYIDGKAEGTVTMERQGAVTVVRADIRDVGRVVRLRLYGDGEGYLGIPVPEGGRLRLVKRLTPLDMKALPGKPAYAGDRPLEGERTGAAVPAAAAVIDPPPVRGRRIIWQGGKPYYF